MKVSNFSAYITEKQKKISENRKIFSNEESLIYFSEGDQYLNFNTKATSSDGEEISCRHLASGFFLFYEDFPEKFSSIESIEAEDFFKNNTFDNDKIDLKANGYYVFDLEQFGNCLSNLCKDMNIGDKKYIYLHSGIHGMAIIAEYKDNPDRFVFKFYEPNRTTVIRRIVHSHLDNIKQLRLEDFINSRDMVNQFNEIGGAFLLYNNPTELTASSSGTKIVDTQYSTNLSKSLYFFLSFNDPHNVKEGIKKAIYGNLENRLEILHAKDTNGVPGLNKAFQEGNAEAIEAYTEEILNSKELDEIHQVELLQAIDKNGVPGLFRALEDGYKNAVEVFIKKILNSKLKNTEKAVIIKSKTGDKNGFTGLYQALIHCENKDAVELYIDELLDSSLSNEMKIEILETKNSDGMSGLFRALAVGNSVAIKTYVNKVLNSRFNVEVKFKLLWVNYKHYSGLPFAIKEGHIDAVYQYTRLICSCPPKIIPKKVQLLKINISELNLTKDSTKEAFTKYCKTIKLSQNLGDKDKKELLGKYYFVEYS